MLVCVARTIRTRLWRKPLLSQISSTRGPAWGGLRVDVPRGPKRSRGANCLYQEVPSFRAGLVRVHREVSPDPRRRGSRFEASAQGHRSTARVRLLRLHRRTAGVFEAGSFMAQRPRCQWTSASPWHGPAVATSRAMQRSGAASTKSLTTSSGASHCERGDSHAPLTGACNKPWLDSKTPGDPP